MMVHLVLCIAYVLTGYAIVRLENKRRLKNGFDSFHVVLFFYGLYVVTSSVVIHAILAVNPSIETGVYFFDSVYQKLDIHEAITVFLLNLVFLAGFYYIRHRFDGTGPSLDERHFALQLRPRVLTFWLLLGVSACGLFFMSLGATFI